MLLKSDRLPFVTSLGRVVRHSSSLGGGNQGTCAVRGFFHGVWVGRAARWGAGGPGSGGLCFSSPGSILFTHTKIFRAKGGAYGYSCYNSTGGSGPGAIGPQALHSRIRE